MTDIEPIVYVPNSLSLSEVSDWECQIVDNLALRPNKGREPKRFHRFMQGVAFGFRWRKWK